jgi:hypothetical protein
MKHLRRFNESLDRAYRLVWTHRNVGQDLDDILLEINDDTFWGAECWYEYLKWIVVITVKEDEELDEEGQNPPTFVIETIKRSIDFMNGEGFINYKIMFGSDSYKALKNVSLDDLSSSEIWPDEFIRIEFTK